MRYFFIKSGIELRSKLNVELIKKKSFFAEILTRGHILIIIKIY